MILVYIGDFYVACEDWQNLSIQELIKLNRRIKWL